MTIKITYWQLFWVTMFIAGAFVALALMNDNRTGQFVSLEGIKAIELR